MLACESEHYDVIVYLLDEFGDDENKIKAITQKDANGFLTALMIVAVHGYKRLLELLINALPKSERRRAITLTNNEGYNCYELANGSNKNACTEIFYDHMRNNSKVQGFNFFTNPMESKMKLINQLELLTGVLGWKAGDKGNAWVKCDAKILR